jgi:hypothetical protein
MLKDPSSAASCDGALRAESAEKRQPPRLAPADGAVVQEVRVEGAVA